MPRWATRRALPVTALLFALTACTSADPVAAQTPSAAIVYATPSLSASGTASAAPTVEPQAQPAVEAYEQFFTLGLDATRNPGRLPSEPVSGGADFRNFSFDPMRGQYTAFVLGLASDKVAFKGTPPTPQITVSTVDLTAKPYPMVVLSNCPTPAPTWKAYSIATGAEVPTSTSSVPPPYRLRVEVIQYQGRWGVSKVTADNTATCTA